MNQLFQYTFPNSENNTEDIVLKIDAIESKENKGSNEISEHSTIEELTSLIVNQMIASVKSDFHNLSKNI